MVDWADRGMIEGNREEDDPSGMPGIEVEAKQEESDAAEEDDGDGVEVLRADERAELGDDGDHEEDYPPVFPTGVIRQEEA